VLALGHKPESKFYLLYPDGSDVAVSFGNTPSETWQGYPVTGDWDGDGQDTIGIYNQKEGKFYFRNSNTTGPANTTIIYGNPNDIPIVGRWSSAMNYDGIGVFRDGMGFYTSQRIAPPPPPITGTSTPTATLSAPVYDNFFIIFGNASDQPVVGDWDGDGYDSVGVYRPTNGYFYLTNQLTGAPFADYAFPFGDPGVLPFAGAWTCAEEPCTNKVAGVGTYNNGLFLLRYSLSLDQFSIKDIGYGNWLNSEVIPLAGNWKATILTGYGTPMPTATLTPLPTCVPPSSGIDSVLVDVCQAPKLTATPTLTPSMTSTLFPTFAVIPSTPTPGIPCPNGGVVVGSQCQYTYDRQKAVDYAVKYSDLDCQLQKLWI
jgi:hypothetical protein